MTSAESYFDATGPVFNFDMTDPDERAAYYEMCRQKWVMAYGYQQDASIADMEADVLPRFCEQFDLHGDTASWDGVLEAHRKNMVKDFELKADASWDEIAETNLRLEAMAAGLSADASWEDLYATQGADPILGDQDLGVWHSWESVFMIAEMLLNNGRLTAVGVVSQDERRRGSWVATHLEEMGDPRQTLENLRQMSPMLYEGMTQFELQLAHVHPYPHPMATSPDGLILAIIYSN